MHETVIWCLLALVPCLFVSSWVRQKRKAARLREAAAAEVARQRAEFAPVEARAALTQWVLLRQTSFELAEAVQATRDGGRPMTSLEVADVCATLSVAVPTIRGLLPSETLRPMPKERPKLHTVVRNGARVTSIRPPETMRMTRAEFLEWQRAQAKAGS